MYRLYSRSTNATGVYLTHPDAAFCAVCENSLLGWGEIRQYIYIVSDYDIVRRPQMLPLLLLPHLNYNNIFKNPQIYLDRHILIIKPLSISAYLVNILNTSRCNITNRGIILQRVNFKISHVFQKM